MKNSVEFESVLVGKIISAYRHSGEPRKKSSYFPLCYSWLIGILRMVCYSSLYNWVVCHPQKYSWNALLWFPKQLEVPFFHCSGEASLGNRRCADGFGAAFRGGGEPSSLDRWVSCCVFVFVCCFVRFVKHGVSSKPGANVCLYRQGSLNRTFFFSEGSSLMQNLLLVIVEGFPYCMKSGLVSYKVCPYNRYKCSFTGVISPRNQWSYGPLLTTGDEVHLVS